MNLRDQIKAAEDLPHEPVECSGWGVTVHVATMTGKERDNFEYDVSKATRKNDNRGLKLRLVMLTACDEKGERLFANDDAEWLEQKSAKEIDRLANVALRINGFTDKDVADLEKN